ncbi:MAG: beta-ketoacyl synthase chain length factor [Tannerellaceae bacterium]|jgi:hypothetical protein|nr:beta-ketoacyl synthase chain length factor [Tannerellaceae bacterium]
MIGQSLYINSIASVNPPVEPDYKKLIPNATVRRRMSRIVRMGVAAGLQCLAEGKDVHPDAILTATGLGCLADTEKFMNTLLDHDESLLAPTAFIQSTFNTIGAQIALLTDNHCYNNTFVHRGFSLESALLDAALLLCDGEARNVLVGAVDELLPTLSILLERLGYLKQVKPGEGAAFFLLSNQPADTSYVILQDIKMINGSLSPKEIEEQVHVLLSENQVEQPILIRPEEFKSYCGEYPTAMSFGLWYACKRLRETGETRHILLCNSFLDNHSFILLKGR